jgi:hypothetical protein
MRRGDITLVAMPPSGEVFIARDDDAMWLVQPPGAGGPQRIDEETVARAVADHGFDLIEERFAGWAELDAERQRRAGIGLATVNIDVEGFDAEDMRGVLRALERFRRRGQTGRARRVAHRLLEAPVVRLDDELYERVVALLRDLDDEHLSLPVPTADPRRREARERLQLVA